MSKEDKISKLVKDSFENQNAGSAPDLWDGISSDLNEANGIDKHVKESFESVNSKAPELWGAMSSQLDNKPSNIDSFVKDSFEANNSSAPETTWEKLQNQMDINLVWKRISEDLDKKPVFAWWRLAALFLLLISSAAAIPFIYSGSAKVFESKQSTAQFDQGLEHPYFNLTQAGVKDQFDFITKNQYLNLLSDIFGENYIGQENNESYTSTEGNDFERGITVNSSIPSLAENEKDNYFDLMAPTNISMIVANHEPNYYRPGKVKIENEPDKKHHFSVGLIGGIQNTWIIDDNLKQSYSSESLVSTSPAFGENFGLNIDYEFNKESGITSELFYSSRMRQRINYYDQGKYIKEKTNINYYKISLLYYKEKWIQGTRFNHQLKFGFGGYAGIRKSNLTVQNNEVITSLNTGYERYDYGVRMILGEEYEGKKWIFGYGLQSEVGLHNIEKSPNNSSSNLNNVASNLNIGIFTTIRYKL